MHKHPPTLLLLKRQNGTKEIEVKFNNFADGDTHCLIEEAPDIKGSAVFVRHFLYPNQNEQIVRLLFLVATLKDLGAVQITVFVPYLPYARQDKAHLPGEIISSKLLCRLIHESGVDMLYTVDCHFMKGAPETEVEGLKIRNILVQNMLIKHLETLTSEPYHIIGPDAGAAYLAGGETMKKTRSTQYDKHTDGSIRRSVDTIDDTHLTITDKTVVVADDMVSTGGTMIRALDATRQRGVANTYAMTSHGLFLQGSFDKINALTQGVIYSDTITRDGSVPVVDEIFASIVGEQYIRHIVP